MIEERLEFILLGLLKEKPKHGYQIKKEINDILSLFAGVDITSVYYPLKVLEKNAFVRKSAESPGQRPQRYVYELTQKGAVRFHSLLAKSFLNFTRPEFSLDLSLYFLKYLNPRLAERRLRARIFILKQLCDHLRQMIKTIEHKRTASLRRIVEHNLQMVETEIGFLANLIGEFKS